MAAHSRPTPYRDETTVTAHPRRLGGVAEPFADMADSKPVIELAGRIPVEHVKIDPAPATLDRDRGKPRHQPSPDSKTTCRLRDIEIFEIQPRPAKPGREAAVEQRRPGGFAIEKRQDRLELRVRPEAVANQIGLGRDNRVWCPFEDRELPDEPQQQGGVIGGGEAHANVAHHSRHSPGALAGWPKSRGTRPAWNQVTNV